MCACTPNVIVTPPIFTLSIGKMAMQSTRIAVYHHVISHFNSNELRNICVSHNYLFEKNMFIRKVKKWFKKSHLLLITSFYYLQHTCLNNHFIRNIVFNIAHHWNEKQQGEKFNYHLEMYKDYILLIIYFWFS